MCKNIKLQWRVLGMWVHKSITYKSGFRSNPSQPISLIFESTIGTVVQKWVQKIGTYHKQNEIHTIFFFNSDIFTVSAPVGNQKIMTLYTTVWNFA